MSSHGNTGTTGWFRRLAETLSGEPRDLDQLQDLCDMVKNTSLCGLGQTAPNPVLSTLRFFRQEYAELLKKDGQPTTK